MKVMDSLLNVIEMYINEKIILSEKDIQIISMIFFNTGLCGSETGSETEKNKFKNYFDENNGLGVLVNLFKYLISRTTSPIGKRLLIISLLQSASY
jgi:hypothetical protein